MGFLDLRGGKTQPQKTRAAQQQLCVNPPPCVSEVWASEAPWEGQAPPLWLGSSLVKRRLGYFPSDCLAALLGTAEVEDVPQADPGSHAQEMVWGSAALGRGVLPHLASGCPG